MADATTSATDTTITPDNDTTNEPDQTETDWKAEAEKWQKLSRKNEDRAKENAKKAKDLDELHRASMSDTEKALAEAETRGRTSALQQVGARLVDAEVRVAAAGRTVDIDAVLEGLDRSRFLTEDGDPDTDAIQTWVDRIAPAQNEENEPGPLGAGIDLGQGSRQSTPIGDDKAFERMLTDLVGK